MIAPDPIVIVGPAIFTAKKLGTFEFPPSVQGQNIITHQIVWEQLDGSPLDLTGATITGVIQGGGIIFGVTGLLTVTNAVQGRLTWEPSDQDTAIAGILTLQFSATIGAGTITSFPMRWPVEQSLAITAPAPPPPLSGLTPAQIACLNDLCRLIKIGLTSTDSMDVGTLDSYARTTDVGTGRIFIHEAKAGLWGISVIDGEVTYCDVSAGPAFTSVVNGIIKLPAIFPDGIFAGPMVLDRGTLANLTLTGIIFNEVTGEKFCRLTSAVGAESHRIETHSDKINVDSGGNAGLINVIFGEDSGALPTFADDAAAAALVTGQQFVTDGTGSEIAGKLRIKQAVSPPAQTFGVTPIQDPPTTTAWLDQIIPDTVGDGSGTLMQNVTGGASTVYFIDFSAATASSQITSFAPVGAKWAVGITSRTDTLGGGNDANILWSPKAAENPPTTALFSHLASNGAVTQSVRFLMDANQIVAFKSSGPAGSFLSTSVFFFLMGYE